MDEYGGVCWPAGPDLAPDAMHSELTGKPPPQPDHSRRRPNAMPPRNRQEAAKFGETTGFRSLQFAAAAAPA